MKFVLLALVGMAAAAPEATPWCIRPGQPCWKVKRAAEAFTESLSSSNAGGLLARAPEAAGGMAGRAAFAAKRSLGELAQYLALTQEDPYSYYTAFGFEDEDASAEETSTEEKRDEDKRWCMRPGQPCWKRDAEANPEAVQEDKRWCMRPGQPCWKAKRAAEAVLDIDAGAVAKREAETEDKRWCMRPGQPCWKAKREAEAEAVAEDKRWCMRPGQPCWKRSEDKRWCMRPGQPCWKAKRDLVAAQAVARDIIADLE
jgi:hypothetical protein